ncbi:UbiH/UbiF family hydroxylase [Mesorhizobium sp. BAC0120]|uniref:UbiH/UbiF family hydroxylase n=1 Tax=Mesorhizobium sp. BAC0120 TaxID=3090670 RepID=UPI00298C8F36|nr:UbiH/UbiF family hydroxylase [Mesorhizobium sp. BAC0120]MDW6023031.1 UbiH/UbiF family hydroxylase [Mesorhizobium sp. BAC0120]
MVKTLNAEIVVAGTGPTGMIAALGLAHAGFFVALAGPRPRGDDRRTTALMRPALTYLDSLGILQRVAGEAAPLSVMRIVDATSRLIRSPIVTFRASEIGEESFGLNTPNTVLNEALETAIAEQKTIEWRQATVAHWEIGDKSAVATLDDRTRIEAPLAIAADGRDSRAREAAGIKTAGRSYRQSALVLNFAHTREHGSTSTEFHTETGPFTQVPLPGNRSSLVWVVRPETAAELALLDDAALSMRIEEKMQSMLGRVTVEPGRQIYPLSSLLPTCFAKNRVALVGEAAHVFPPIGAQGLNLGIRDVEDIVRTASDDRLDPGSVTALAAYDGRRRPDILARSTAVNLLNLSLLSDLLPAQMARSAGLGALKALSPVRAFFMREGMQPGSGFARIVSSLREQMWR